MPEPTVVTAETEPLPEPDSRPDIELELNDRHACMRRGEHLECWGSDITLPDAEDADPESAMSMPGTGSSAFAIGVDRICTIRAGVLSCWGHDDYLVPPMTDADPIQPIEVVDDSGAITAVDIREETVCSVSRVDGLTCWTYEEPDDEDRVEYEKMPEWMEKRPLRRDVVAFSVGADYACGIASGGVVECWGDDTLHIDHVDRQWQRCLDEADDQCDDDDDCDQADPSDSCAESSTEALEAAWNQPIAVEGIPRPLALAAGVNFTCALSEEGSVFCWGRGDAGQLGNGSTEGSEAPVRVRGLDDAIAIGAGETHACAVLRDGQVACWGDNSQLAVGGDRMQGVDARLVPGVSDAIDVVLASDLSCAVVREGPPLCWGDDRSGRVRDRDLSTSIAAVPIEGVQRLLPFVDDTCVSREDGAMMWWGRHALGRSAGLAERITPRTTPYRDLLQLLPLGPCAIDAASELRCWRSVKEFHAGGPSSRVLKDVVRADATRTHACAVTGGGQVHCWMHAKGILPVPTLVTAVATSHAVAVGPKNACAVLDDGLVSCWTLDSGLTRPTWRLKGVEGAVDITKTDQEVCVLTGRGRVLCWKWKELDRAPLEHPLESVDALVSGGGHFCALVDGRAQCWGLNHRGQLGTFDGIHSSGPLVVQGLPPLVDLAAGREHTCGRTKEGRVHCWGRDQEGQLGRIPSSYMQAPVPMYRADVSR